jgi:hypothetical protein
MTSAPAFAATFGRADVNTNANTFLGDVFQGNPGISVTHNAHASSLPSTLLTAQQSQSFSSVPQSSPFVGQDKITSTDDAQATFASADAGTFHADSSWTAILPDSRGAAFGEMDNFDKGIGLLPAFDYQFDATAGDGLFSMTFAVVPTSDTPFIQRGAWDMNLIEDGTDVLAGHSVKFLSLNDGGSGVFSVALQAGHHYELRLRDNAGLVLPNTTFRNINATNTADFAWNINPAEGGGGTGGVPEPSTWALTVLGFGLTGAALRQTASRRPAPHSLV